MRRSRAEPAGPVRAATRTDRRRQHSRPRNSRNGRSRARAPACGRTPARSTAGTSVTAPA